MAINFPDSPSVGTTFTSGVKTWTYDGEKWLLNNASNLDGLTDVAITSAASGQLLVHDGSQWVNTVLPTNEPTGHENRANSTISFNNSTRVFTISPVSTSHTVWCAGKRFAKTSAETVTIPNTTGIYYIYYNSTGVLSYKTTYFDFENEAPTAYIYWNSSTAKAELFAEERHGIVLDWQTHEYLHRTIGAAIASGFNASGYTISGDGSLNTHAQIALTGGTFFDEDLQVDITHSATPAANSWQQVLEGTALLPVFYISGTTWRRDAATSYPLKTGTSLPTYNLNTAGTWTTPDIANNKYGISWVIATNNLDSPVAVVLGQDSYNTLSDAEAVNWENMTLPDFPIFEFRPLHKIIYQCASAYTNTPKAAIRGVYDLRRVISSGSSIPSSPVPDHGALTGLADDDHLQYLTTGRHNSDDHSGVSFNISSPFTIRSSGTTEAVVDAGTVAVNTQLPALIDSFVMATYMTVDYTVQIKQGTKVRSSKVMVVTDGTSIDKTEYAVQELNGTISGVVIDTAVSGINGLLRVTVSDANITPVTVRFHKTSINA